MSKQKTVEDAPRSAGSGHVVVGDPNDKALIRQLARFNKIPYLFLALSLAANFVMYWRKPEVFVVRDTCDGKRVVVANNREYRMDGDIRLMPDNPTDGDKIYLVSKFTNLLFGIDPQGRKLQLEWAYSMMQESFAARYLNEYKASGQLDLQRDERWQAKWEPQQIEVDRVDPYLVHVLGTQDITKTKDGHSEREIVQHALDFKLSDDSPRSSRNLRTGFLIAAFSGKEVSRRKADLTDGQTQLPN
jgi:hypothetical protein